MKDRGSNVAGNIADYALIGDCSTAALVGLDGSIDWLCWPTFASEACFAKLLGSKDNGYWQLAPKGKILSTRRRYQDHTLILETTHTTRGGTVRVVDFMPRRSAHSRVIRMVECLRGSVKMRGEFVLRFGYGQSVPWVTHTRKGIRAVAGPDSVELQTKAPLRGEDSKTVSEFTVRQGETVTFSLICGTYGDYREKSPPKALAAITAYRQTRMFWQKWTAKHSHGGPYDAMVERSLITLKALTFEPTGAVVAAPTTSLPEEIGGVRNWDYRFCWLRDATFTLRAFMYGGHFDEARDWTRWLRRTIAGSVEQLQIMYGIRGERYIPESKFDGLAGYRRSLPVRIGNLASKQVQLDIYGEVLGVFALAFSRLKQDARDDFDLLHKMVDHLETIWEKPDSGIWEVRGGPKQFTYSKVMAWVAFDRAIQIAEQRGFDAPLRRWKKTRAAIHAQVCAKAFDKRQNSFMQHYGSRALDASVLLMPLVGFLPPDDPRMIGTVEAVQKHLLDDGLVMRYRPSPTADGLAGGEGKFLACSFWLVSALHAIGRREEAHRLFKHLLSLANDVGLFSEEYDTRGKRFVGNFPQAFSHIALITAANRLASPGKINPKPKKRI